MKRAEAGRVGYVVKRYPRYSETFIVNEILAHEAAGLDVQIYSLRRPEDTHFQEAISRVRAPVTYLPDAVAKASEFWEQLQDAAAVAPHIWSTLSAAAGEQSRDVLHALALARTIRTDGVTHLHAHFATSATSVARLAAQFCGIPYTFTAHAKDIFHESVDDESLRVKFRDAAKVVTVSDFNIDYLTTRFGPTSRLVRVYNGLDLDRFPYQDPADRPAVIVAVGRLVEKKGFDDLVRACALLRERGHRFECRIVGSGPERAGLLARIAELGLEDAVALLGPRPQPEIIRLVQEAAVFAAPCVVGGDGNRDGLPTVLLEAMALGTPCVATDVTGIPEIVRDGYTGLLVGQRNPEALANGLARLLSDRVLRHRLAARARASIERNFDVHRNAARLRDLFAVTPVLRAVGAG